LWWQSFLQDCFVKEKRNTGKLMATYLLELLSYEWERHGFGFQSSQEADGNGNANASGNNCWLTQLASHLCDTSPIHLQYQLVYPALCHPSLPIGSVVGAGEIVGIGG
jgi:hypothetical protein